MTKYNDIKAKIDETIAKLQELESLAKQVADDDADVWEPSGEYSVNGGGQIYDQRNAKANVVDFYAKTGRLCKTEADARALAKASAQRDRLHCWALENAQPGDWAIRIERDGEADIFLPSCLSIGEVLMDSDSAERCANLINSGKLKLDVL